MKKSTTVYYKSHDGNTYDVSIHEDKENWYVDFNTGLGERTYPKKDFTLEEAIGDQDPVFKE